MSLAARSKKKGLYSQATEIPVENQMVCAILFEKLQKILTAIAGYSPTISNIIVFCLCTRFPAGWFV